MTRPGVLAAKLAQPLPGEGDFNVMGGLFCIEQQPDGDGKSKPKCTLKHLEMTPGAHLGKSEILERLGWN